jgi:hypothetical protein
VAGAPDLTAPSRAVLREAVKLLYRVLGERMLHTARGNAWEAVCADRERAQQRDEISRLLANGAKDRPATAEVTRRPPRTRRERVSASR